MLTLDFSRNLGTREVTEGNPNHDHAFEAAPWDEKRFGPRVVNFDGGEALGRPIVGPTDVARRFLHCDCGAEAIRSF